MARVFIDDGRTFCGAVADNVGIHKLLDQRVPVLACSESTARSNGVGGPWEAQNLSLAYLFPQPRWIAARAHLR